MFTGSSTFSIPIEIPTGRKGPVPNITINYRSDAGPSWVGYGWSLSFGSIRRIGLGSKTPTYTTQDEFFFSGAGVNAKLVSAGMGDPAEFRTQHESFMKITRDTVTNQWIVKTPDGSTLEYGVTADSKIEAVLFDQNINNFFLGSGFDQTRLWLLNKITDANGNYVQFSYSEDTVNGDVYPSQIVYSKNDNGDNSIYQMVEFILEARPDVVTSFASGSKVTEDNRLSKIRLWSNQAKDTNLNLIREFRFTYSPTDATDRDVKVVNWISPFSKLVSVQEFGRDAVSNPSAVGLPAYVLEYSLQQTGWGTDQPQYNIPVYVSAYDGADLGTRFADVNFDGITDIIKSNHNERTNLTRGYDRFGNSFDTYSDFYQVYLGNGTGTWTLQAYQPPSSILDGGAYNGAEPFDIDGDLLPDLIKSISGSLYGVYLKQSASSGWGANNTTWANNLPWPLAIPYYSYNADFGTRFADFDGDGLADVIHSVKTTVSGYMTRNLKFNNGDGTWRDSGWILPDRMHFAEFYNNYPPPYPPAHSCDTFPGGTAIFDVNNDGLPDVLRQIWDECGKPNSTSLMTRKTWINTGRGFYEDNSYVTPWYFISSGASGLYDSGERPQDFNRDGLMDFYWNGRIWINRGNGTWADSGVNTPLPTTGTSGLGTYFIDINKDGLIDQGQSHRGCINNDPNPYAFCYPYPDGPDVKHSYLANGTFPNLLKKVTLPSGTTLDYTYSPSSMFDNTGDDTISDLPMIRQVLTSVTVDDKLSTANSVKTTNYTYSGGFYDVPSNEFRGFQYVKMTDPDNYDHETWFNQSNELRGSVQKEVLSYQGQTINKTEYFYDLAETPLQVFSTLPVDNSTNVSINNYPNVTFNKAMTDASINASTVKLIRKSDGVVIAQAAGYPQLDITKKIATIRPASSLAYSTMYQIQVIGGAGGVQSSSGQNLSANYLQPNGFQTQSSGGCTVNCGGCTVNCGGTRDPRSRTKLGTNDF